MDILKLIPDSVYTAIGMIVVILIVFRGGNIRRVFPFINGKKSENVDTFAELIKIHKENIIAIKDITTEIKRGFNGFSEKMEDLTESNREMIGDVKRVANKSTDQHEQILDDIRDLPRKIGGTK